MNKGFSVVLGMSLAYAVSFFGLLLAYIVYQRNNHPDELWRRRPIGISFFSLVYGYALPFIILLNALITLGVKAFKGWDFDLLVWNAKAIYLALPAGLLLFLFLGRQLWRLKFLGYACGLLVALAGTAWTLQLSLQTIFSSSPTLYEIGAYGTGFIWNAFWSFYLIKGPVRQAFRAQNSPA